MENLTIIFLGISGLFLLFLVLKQFLGSRLKEKFCVICAAVVITWSSLLVLSYFRLWNDTLILALLMGETILAVYYILERKENLKLFRLPLLLSLIWVGYSLLARKMQLESTVLILSLWLLFVIIFTFQKNKMLSGWAEKILACCKNA